MGRSFKKRAAVRKFVRQGPPACRFCLQKNWTVTKTRLVPSCDLFQVNACHDCRKSKGSSSLWSWLARSQDSDPHVAPCNRDSLLFVLESRALQAAGAPGPYRGTMRSDMLMLLEEPPARVLGDPECSDIALHEDDPVEDEKARLECEAVDAYLATRTPRVKYKPLALRFHCVVELKK